MTLLGTDTKVNLPDRAGLLWSAGIGAMAAAELIEWPNDRVDQRCPNSLALGSGPHPERAEDLDGHEPRRGVERSGGEDHVTDDAGLGLSNAGYATPFAAHGAQIGHQGNDRLAMVAECLAVDPGDGVDVVRALLPYLHRHARYATAAVL